MSELDSKKKEVIKSYLKDVKVESSKKDSCISDCVSHGPSLPSLYIDTKLVPDFSGKDVGETVLMVVSGKILSHDRYESDKDGVTRDNYRVELGKIGLC